MFSCDFSNANSTKLLVNCYHCRNPHWNGINDGIGTLNSHACDHWHPSARVDARLVNVHTHVNVLDVNVALLVSLKTGFGFSLVFRLNQTESHPVFSHKRLNSRCCDVRVCSDVEVRDSLTTDEEDDDAVAADDGDSDAEGDIETEDESSDDGAGGDVDDLLDEALDEDTEEDNLKMHSKLAATNDSSAAATAKPVSCRYQCGASLLQHASYLTLLSAHIRVLLRCSKADITQFSTGVWGQIAALLQGCGDGFTSHRITAVMGTVSWVLLRVQYVRLFVQTVKLNQ